MNGLKLARHRLVRTGLLALTIGLGIVVALAASKGTGLAPANLWGNLVRAASTAIQSILTLGETLGAWVLQRSTLDLLGILAYVTLIGLVMRLYLVQFRPRLLDQAHYRWLLLLLLVLFVSAALVMIPANTFLLYLFPMAALSILLAMLIDPHLSIMVTILVGLGVGYIAHGSLAFTVYTVMGGLIGFLSLGRMKRVSRVPWTGAYVALSNVTAVLVFDIAGGNYGALELSQLLLMGIANGVLSASLALIGFFMANSWMGITTSVRLLDLVQPTQPLLQQLLLHAPGTYHHSLLVSDLAEQAAERVGADALLTRVGAYYHDIGKMVQPEFFIENQQQMSNGHNGLDPRTSAQIIISHVKEGLKLAKKYRLPREVRAFIAEHQGTGLVKYFYHQALEQADDPGLVDEADFRYPGPRPQSKETAIVMLADSCEAAVRAERPTSTEEIDQTVHRVIIDKVSSGELDECDLTIHDLDQIRSTFVEMLGGMFHPRIKYPEKATANLTVISIPLPVATTMPSTHAGHSEGSAKDERTPKIDAAELTHRVNSKN
jgi:putative nucleotidyltransferase with HDIG domain